MPSDGDVDPAQVRIHRKQVEGVRRIVPVSMMGIGLAHLPMGVQLSVLIAIAESLQVIRLALGQGHGIGARAIGQSKVTDQLSLVIKHPDDYGSRDRTLVVNRARNRCIGFNGSILQVHVEIATGLVYLDRAMVVISPRVTLVWPPVLIGIEECLHLVAVPALNHKTEGPGSSHEKFLHAVARDVHQPDSINPGLDQSGITYQSAQVDRIHRTLVNPEVGTAIESTVHSSIVDRQSARPIDVPRVNCRGTNA